LEAQQSMVSVQAADPATAATNNLAKMSRQPVIVTKSPSSSPVAKSALDFLSTELAATSVRPPIARPVFSGSGPTTAPPTAVSSMAITPNNQVESSLPLHPSMLVAATSKVLVPQIRTPLKDVEVSLGVQEESSAVNTSTRTRSHIAMPQRVSAGAVPPNSAELASLPPPIRRPSFIRNGELPSQSTRAQSIQLVQPIMDEVAIRPGIVQASAFLANLRNPA
jgi:hypothetical protein